MSDRDNEDAVRFRAIDQGEGKAFDEDAAGIGKGWDARAWEHERQFRRVFNGFCEFLAQCGLNFAVIKQLPPKIPGGRA